MAGTAISPAPVDGIDLPSGQTLTPSLVNSFRISAVADRLALHFHGTPQNDAVEFFNLCLSLARGIDYAVANSEVPGRAQELAFLLKQVCQRKNDRFFQAAIMVLMISAKNACAMGWFSVHDCEELLNLANEIAQIFCGPVEANTDERTSLPTISKITSRFYPRFKMGQILAFLEAKPGYGTFVIDFNISKMGKSAAEDKIWLFVAQTDNIETSSCIITPQQVNFLLNGKGVAGRTNVSMDTGPQIPTGATHYLKYGTNLLQAVGKFNGNYIIIIAYMSVISNLDHPVLQDYVQPAIATLDSDSEIIEGPSRISLKCPISFRRIKTPVKGHSCKHLQCFDFDNFVDINSRRPSWRCPHCNQSVCYTDIRVDQNVAKVLREVGENVDDVIISADGSWKAVTETNDQTNQLDGLAPGLQESPSFSGTVPDILDLTEGDDEMDVRTTHEAEDRKPILDNLNPTIPTNEVNPNTVPHIEDDFWSGIFLPPFGLGTSNAQSDTEIAGGIPEPVPTNFMMSPVLTDAVSPALNREAEAFHGNTLLSTSLPQSQISNNLQLQQSQFGNNSILSNEYGRVPAISRNITRTPIAVQALPAQTQTMASIPQQRSMNSLNNLIPNGPSLASQASNGQPSGVNGFNAVSNNMDRQHQFSRLHLNPLQVSHVASSSLQQPPTTMNWDFQNSISSQPAQQIVGHPAPNAFGVPSTLPTSLQHPHQQPPQNLRMPHPLHQSPSLIQSSAQSSPQYQRTRFHPGGTPRGTGPPALGTVNAQQVRMRIAAQQAAKMAQQSSVPMRTHRPPSSYPVNANGSTGSVGDQRWRPGGSMQPVTMAENLVDLSSEQNWRPTGRMRGSLSGQAYSDALSQFILQTTQPVQASRPQADLTSPPPGIPFPPELHGLMANSRNTHALQEVNYPLAQSTGMAGGSSVLPERYLGRN